MFAMLDRRVRQMHLALADAKTSDLSSLEIERAVTAEGFYCAINFNEGTSEAELANVATLLVANIACMKDHLKVWCKKNSSPFEGDNLINTNGSVAIVHDLWNTDKHAELTTPPRSGHRPRLENLKRVLRLSSGDQAGSGSFFSFDPRTGTVLTGTSGSGAVQLALDAQVVDEHSSPLGDFTTLCEQAIAAWEQELKKAGVPLQ